MKLKLSTVDCQQLKYMAAESAGCEQPAMTSCQPPECPTWWGGSGMLQSRCGWRDGGYELRNEDLGRGWQHAELWIAHQEGQPLHRLQQQPWAQHIHVDRTWNWAIIAAASDWGPPDWSMLSPTAVSPGWQNSFTVCWTFSWGPMRDGEESTYVEAQHWAANLAAESEKMGAMPQERAEPYGSSAG
jgi:hypothetical protein